MRQDNPYHVGRTARAPQASGSGRRRCRRPLDPAHAGAEPPRAKSLIVTVWGDALAPHGGTVWLAGLIRLMAPSASTSGWCAPAYSGWRRTAGSTRRPIGRHEPLPADSRRQAPVRRRASAHLCAPRRRLGRHMGIGAGRRGAARAACAAARGTRVVGIRRARARRISAPGARRARAARRRRRAGRGRARAVRHGARHPGTPAAGRRCRHRVGPDDARRRLPPVPAALRRRHRPLPRDGEGAHDPQQCFVVRTLLDPRVSPRAAARPAAARGTAAARLAGRRRVRAMPRFLPAHAPLRRAPSGGHARQRRTRTFRPPTPRSTSASAAWTSATAAPSGCGRSCG